MHVLNMSRAQLFASFCEPMPAKEHTALLKLLESHTEGEPLQYLTGEEQFFGRTFDVNSAVLIPRPETEELVDEVIKQVQSFFEGQKPLRIVDVGTGSGIIAVSLACAFPDAEVWAIDISEEALAVAERNAKRHQANVHFLQGDLLSPFIAKELKAHVVVSNPPYIAEEEWIGLDMTVRDHEPKRALCAGVDGLDMYRTLCTQLPVVLTPTGMVAFEVGFTQGKAVRDMLSQSFPNAHVRVNRDINGLDRIVLATH
ncbi:peptide chain release factor N(5)-glutamine methyltransferase [Bacillaceae bacterium SIJ1]|uniref:peptide chain release factor N(5)-glutamine methyltransferase n=1 Tax=Litoribacterium kuwaitense TaxID=1398745 RepID=UPI0013E9AA02|nr:peptide chain release factor N(5)-glutamine methyltransferase [Litoribacterium kuwaitense]NGP44720.1 peptide chain release factor N(5)-glutamine methyltransferase [Litoribacterium kuwaitense]